MSEQKVKGKSGNPNAKKGLPAINKGMKLRTAAALRDRNIEKVLEVRRNRKLRKKHYKQVKERKRQLRGKQKLIPTQEMVVNEFFKCGFNQTRAYRRVYGDGPIPNLGDLVHQIFTSEKVKAEIARRFEEMKYLNAQTQVMFQDRAEASIEDFTVWDEKLCGLVYDDKKADASGKKHLIRKIHFFSDGTLKDIEIAEPEFSLDKIARIQQQYAEVPLLPPLGSERGKDPIQEILDIIHANKKPDDSTGK